ncbi:MAG: peptidase M23 [Melioribacteraceae bacterium]|nr:MAG: peptidase M23 [Melioribacteraceae bacterium]
MGYVKVYFILLIFSSSGFAQSGEIDKENQKLARLQSEISSLQGELNSLSVEEENTYTHLEKLKKEELLLNKLINELKAEEYRATQRINQLTRQINSHEQDIGMLKDSYSRYIVWQYKKAGRSELKYIFSANSLNEMYLRYKNMEFLHDAYADVKSDLENSINTANNQKADLQEVKNQKQLIIEKKRKEADIIDKNRNEKQILLAKLKKNQHNLETEIDEKRKAQLAIKDLISKLIREAEARRLASSEKEKEEIPDFSYKGNTKLQTLRGKLEWPLYKGTIVRKFGNNKNPKLKTVTVNYGVDIRAMNSSDVRVVASGVISAIEWIPGYGSIIIVNHNDNYRTVYGHVNNISVREGANVTAGDVIANVAESIEGKVLHFEVWDGRKNENPELWLAKK